MELRKCASRDEVILLNERTTKPRFRKRSLLESGRNDVPAIERDGHVFGSVLDGAANGDGFVLTRQERNVIVTGVSWQDPGSSVRIAQTHMGHERDCFCGVGQFHCCDGLIALCGEAHRTGEPDLRQILQCPQLFRLLGVPVEVFGEELSIVVDQFEFEELDRMGSEVGPGNLGDLRCAVGGDVDRGGGVADRSAVESDEL